MIGKFSGTTYKAFRTDMSLGIVMRRIRKPILMIVLLLLTASLASCAEDNISKIIVQGEGKASAPADKVTMVLGVETRDESAAAAVSENAGLMNETINALLAAGVEESEIKTSSYSLSTSAEEDGLFSSYEAEETSGAPEFIARNMVTVSLNDTARAGAILDVAVFSGSNRIREIAFDLQNPQPQKDLALTLAIEDARRKAEIAAKAAGLSLGRILEISEGYGYVTSASKSFAFDLSTPISPGEMEITASVTMTYEIS